jgi:hypothetical protein
MILAEAAEIRAGYQFRSGIRAHVAGDVPVIQVKDVREGYPLEIKALTCVEFPADPTPYQIRRDDVLFLSRGQRPFATLVDVDPGGAVASSYYYIVRTRGNLLLPAYLAWYLNQAPTRERLRPSHVGTHMPIVSKAAFEQLEIELPSLDVQRQIAELDRLARREARLLDDLHDARRRLITDVCLRAARSNPQGQPA